jgi:hypothetical protein
MIQKKLSSLLANSRVEVDIDVLSTPVECVFGHT